VVASRSLFRKYAAVLMLLVGGALVASQMIGVAFDYAEIHESATATQALEVRSAVGTIDQYLRGIERQIQEVGALPWSSGLLGTEDRRVEFHRLMKLVPAIAEIRYVDGVGRERLKASRTERDEIDSLRPPENTTEVAAARSAGTYFSDVFFADGSEPFVTLAVRDRTGFGVTLALLNLKFVGDVVSRIRIGEAGGVYVVDGASRLIAHPNLSLVLRQTQIRDTPVFRGIQQKLRETPAAAVGMFEARDLAGREVMVSAAPLASAQWLVVAEQPRSEVLEPLYGRLVRSAVILLAGLLLAIAASRSLARRLAQPILRVRRGAERLAGGDLSTRIDVRTGDEIEALARQFNVMADQLQGYTTGLEQRVAEKTAELELANRHKNEFLANMSHELRTPLNAVIGFSDALRDGMFGPLNAKQLEYVGDINGSGQHLLSLINDILDLAKIEAGRMELDVRRFDVASALENCRTLIRERAHRQGLTLDFEVAQGLGTWQADERKFKQIVLNLLTNAVKFTPAGGRVKVAASNGGDWLEVSVDDTGPGIAPADHDRIFEEFRQLRAEGEAKNEGTGLGLALTRRLVELHGGAIELDSDLGRGARFVVRLPREPSPAHG
jgi:signal transduction histidine kinase